MSSKLCLTVGHNKHWKVILYSRKVNIEAYVGPKQLNTMQKMHLTIYICHFFFLFGIRKNESNAIQPNPMQTKELKEWVAESSE